MDAQLRLLTTPDPPVARPDDVVSADDAPALEPGRTAWRLSESTRARGRRGIARVRDELRRSQPAAGDGVVGAGAIVEPRSEPSAA